MLDLILVLLLKNLLARLNPDYLSALRTNIIYLFNKGRSSLPGRFSTPHSEMLLARANSPGERPIGWIGLRPFPELTDPGVQLRDTDVCEAKRLFVLEEYGGLGIGRALVKAVVKTAKKKGFKEMRISVEKKLGREIEMYKRWGFMEIGKCFESVVPDLVYLSLLL